MKVVTRGMTQIVVATCVLLPQAGHAEMALDTLRYACERGVEVPVAYVTDDSASVAVLTVEGRQLALWQEPAASGARYTWPSDGSGYVWWTKGTEATLAWKDAAAGTETVLLSACKVTP